MSDTLLVWGFLLSFIGLLGGACYEAWKLVAVVPAAFESSPEITRNPMNASQDQPSRSDLRRMTPQQRAQYEKSRE